MRLSYQQKIILIAVAAAAVFIAMPWLLLLLVVVGATLLVIPSLRVKLITSPLFKHLAKSMPTVSHTERAAIEAGTIWWEQGLLCGTPDWQKLNRVPLKTLSDEEKNFLGNETSALCRLVNNQQVQRQKDLPAAAWTFIKAKGFLGMIIPRDYGGLEFSATAHAAVVAKLASRNPVLAVTVMVPNSLGPAELLMNYGTQEQKDYYLPRLARGDEIPCFALTSIKAGSDASALEDFGIVCQDQFEGRSCLGLRITWRKRYITLAPIATLIGLAIKVYDPQQLLDKEISGGRTNLGISCVLVPSTISGVHRGRRHNPLGTYFYNGPTWGDKVFIPLDYVIGGPQNLGHGWRMLVECLSVGRSISLPALSEAAAHDALYTSSVYARVREQFHRPIGHFEGVQEQLVRLAVLSHTTAAVNRLSLTALDLGEKPSVVSAMVKYFCTENARRAVNIAMDVHGGKAIIEGERNYLAGKYKSLPILITVEGANILTRSLMIFGQGVLRCHPYLYQEFRQFEKTKARNIQKFDELAQAHARYHLKNLLRALGYAMVPWRWLPSGVPADTQPHIRQLMRRLDYLSALFAYLADTAVLVLGGAFKRKEMISGRFADVWMSLYAGAALIHDALKNPDSDDQLTELAGRHYCNQAESALYDVCRALPKPVGSIARFLLFPFGKKISRSDDQQCTDFATRLINDHQLLRQFTKSADVENYTELRQALALTVQTQDIRNTIRKKLKKTKIPTPQSEEQWLSNLLTQGIIEQKEFAQLKQWQQAVRNALAVDDYEQL